MITLKAYAEKRVAKDSYLLYHIVDTINLQDLDIKEGPSVRRIAIGARILEKAMGQILDVANRLAEVLERVFNSMARVVLPMKLASLRVSGLDDYVTKEMVAEAVVKASECDAGAVRIHKVLTTYLHRVSSWH